MEHSGTALRIVLTIKWCYSLFLWNVYYFTDVILNSYVSCDFGVSNKLWYAAVIWRHAPEKQTFIIMLITKRYSTIYLFFWKFLFINFTLLYLVLMFVDFWTFNTLCKRHIIMLCHVAECQILRRCNQGHNDQKVIW